MGIPDTMAGAQQNGANGSTNGGPTTWAAKHNLAPHFIGGNHLGQAAPSKVKEFVAAHDGHTVITNVRSLQEAPTETEELTIARAGAHCEQRNCGSQGNPLGAEMGI
jgi:acetyl-CoA carboxylase/biotin carboxylase 1